MIWYSHLFKNFPQFVLIHTVKGFPWSGKWLPSPAFLPGEFHGQSSVADVRPWDRKESNLMELVTLSCIC